MLTVKVNPEINPDALEVDHSFQGTLPEFWVYADPTSPYGDASDEAAFALFGITVTYTDGEWTMTIPKTVVIPANTPEYNETASPLPVNVSGIKFYLKLVDEDGNEYGSMYNGGWLTVTIN